uniref:Uncharacterized protein n=1 Tax=Tanacetum cinerariifolium TaxID=118510 RepID=A0A699IIH8_TANCI|nr:hypothetical protein [Tanacetum cinerariifolium]
MADFMSEMAVMMSENKPNGNGESFEELQDLFDELFESDIESYGSTSQTSYSSSSFSSFGESSSSNSSNKRGSSAMSNAKTEDPFCYDPHFQGFSLGTGGRHEDRSGSRRKGRHV